MSAKTPPCSGLPPKMNPRLFPKDPRRIDEARRLRFDIRAYRAALNAKQESPGTADASAS
jgi:hypothetical protein